MDSSNWLLDRPSQGERPMNSYLSSDGLRFETAV
jgi:hypothetical protein